MVDNTDRVVVVSGRIPGLCSGHNESGHDYSGSTSAITVQAAITEPDLGTSGHPAALQPSFSNVGPADAKFAFGWRVMAAPSGRTRKFLGCRCGVSPYPRDEITPAGQRYALS